MNLLAGAPVSDEWLPENLEGIAPLADLSPGLSSGVLLRRPDIMAAEARLQAANAFIGTARSAFFPRIALTSAIGTASDELSGLFGSGSGSGTWSFAPQISLPVFDARTWAAYRVSKSTREIALAHYEKAIQTAFREVADALALQGTVNQQIASQESIVNALTTVHGLPVLSTRSGCMPCLAGAWNIRSEFGEARIRWTVRRSSYTVAGTMKSEYRIGSVWGIPIHLHISLFLLMGYFALRSGWTGFAAGGYRGGAISILLILVFVVLIFASIALHELGHSFVAIRKGCKVREITLMFIGGAAKMEQMPRRPRDEFLMAGAGPVVSAVLGALVLTAVGLLPADAGLLLAALKTLLHTLGIVNILLAGFNLLPAFPMDGGRIFRAALTPKLGRLRATLAAARLGKGIAILFAIVGIFGIPPYLARSPFMLFIALFIFIYGDREYRMVQIEELMRQRGFGSPPPFPGGPDTPVDDHTVLISPPPYAKGPALRTEIQRERPARQNPFRDLFGQ